MKQLFDGLGQVTSGRKYWPDGTPVAGLQFTYGFDDIGNRKTAASGGDKQGGNLHYQNYTANNLNQYTSRTVPGFVDVTGAGNSNATVTVWGDNGAAAPSIRQGEHFYAALAVNNPTGAVWLTLTNIAVLPDGTNPDNVTNTTGKALIARTPESFAYDLDGNLTSDSLWTNSWNAENRRALVESRATVPSAARAREQWTYLPDGRWIERVVSSWNGSAWVPQYTNRYVWDGQVLMAVLDHTNGVVLSFMRGLDLSGSVQGAGGVGGLLAASQFSNSLITNSHFACLDGNGDVVALVAADDVALSAEYEYGPFGEPIRATGPGAKANPIRFSTQYADDVTGELKYLFRDYNSTLGRWSSRDPVEEQGGLALYGFVGNDPINSADKLGMAWDPKDPSTWLLPKGGVWTGKPGNSNFIPFPGSQHADLAPIKYRNGVPVLSAHPLAKIDGQVHIVILPEWDGTGNDQKEAARRLKASLPEGDYVWHHEEIVDVNGKKGIKMVLVPRRLNSLSHSGPASWRRAALSIGSKANAILGRVGKCLSVIAVVSWVADPGGAIAAPFGGETTMGDATLTGAMQRAITTKFEELDRVNNVQQYRQWLLELRDVYRQNPLWCYEHLIPLIEQHLQVIDSDRPQQTRLQQ